MTHGSNEAAARMSAWTHPICEDCFGVLYPRRQRYRVVEPESETCCRCMTETMSGLYVRADPELVGCAGHD